MPDPQRTTVTEPSMSPSAAANSGSASGSRCPEAPKLRDLADAPTILAIHGVTASHRCWDMLAAALPGYRLITPDLRGRGRSNTLPGPYGMAQHADDMADVLDFLGVPQALVVGHSMGGFVSVMFAHRHAGRVAALLLVDGGMPLRMPDGMTTDSLIAAFGPAADRLSMTFPDYEAYRNFLAGAPRVRRRLEPGRHQLHRLRPGRHSAGTAPRDPDRGDDRGYPRSVRDRTMLEAVAKLPAPTIFLRAPLGFFNDPPGIYSPDWIAALATASCRRWTSGWSKASTTTPSSSPISASAAVKDAVLESLRRARPAALTERREAVSSSPPR